MTCPITARACDIVGWSTRHLAPSVKVTIREDICDNRDEFCSPKRAAHPAGLNQPYFAPKAADPTI